MHCMFTNVDSNITQEHVYIHIGHAQKHININHSYYQTLVIITFEQQSVDISTVAMIIHYKPTPVHTKPIQEDDYFYKPHPTLSTHICP